jgi:hypothetical protein
VSGDGRADPDDGRYLAGHLHEALLTDARVGEQDLDVHIADDTVHVSGTVATPARREAVAMVIAERAPGWRIRNDVQVVPTTDPPDREELP